VWDLPSPTSDDAEVDVKNERLMGELEGGQDMWEALQALS
jgi:hypothetical protein